jgi:glycosyltransferase involved in cell wall biosynthesis
MKISIVTITYNAARTLQRTLDSVACQTYADIEHLIIDGASKDATVAIAERYKAASRHEVVIQSEPDKGLYDAMNKGLQKATGDYLVFLNAGDTLYAPDTIETVVRCVQQPPLLLERAGGEAPAVIYGDTAITDAEGNFLHLRTHRPPEQLTWKSFKQGMLVCHQAFYVLTSLARQIPYDLQYRHSADVDWCIRIMREAERQQLALVNTHAILANFEEGGDTTQHHRDSLKERFKIMMHHYGLVQTVVMHAWFILRAVARRFRK